MPGDREREKENYQYLRTTCGLIGFIVFFLGSFLSFTIAAETGEYYQYIIIIGFVMLFVTIVFFCCVLHESKKIHPSEFNEREAEQAFLLQDQPEPELPEESPEPFWSPRRPSSTENDSDSEMIQLQNMAKSPYMGREPMPGTSREPQAYDTTSYEDAADFQFESPKAGPSTLPGKSFDPNNDDIPFMDKSSLHSSKSSIKTEKQADVSAPLFRLSLDNSEKQAASMPSQVPSSTDSGSTSEDRSQHSETSIKEGGESKLQSKKEA